MLKPFTFALLAGTVLTANGAAHAGVTVYDSEAAFDAAVSVAVAYTPVQDTFYATSYAFGPVTETAPMLVTYTGDYGSGVRSLGAFLDPVTFASTQTALGLSLGYFVGPQTATYTIDGVSGTIDVPDNDAAPNTVFVGFTDTQPISVSFTTDQAEFDTLRVVSAAASATPEPSTWALLLTAVGGAGLALRCARRTASAPAPA